MKKEIIIPVATGASIGLALAVYRIYRKRLVDANRTNLSKDVKNNTDVMKEESENKGFSKTNYIQLR